MAEHRLSVTFFSLPTKAATVWTEDRHKIIRQSVALQHTVDGGNGQLDCAGVTECFSRDVLITHLFEFAFDLLTSYAHV